jgi:hypothetical protein
VGVVIDGVSCAMTGIQSTQESSSSTSTELKAAAALTGLGVIMVLITFFVFVAWSKKHKKGGKFGGKIPGMGKGNQNQNGQPGQKHHSKSAGLGWLTVILFAITTAMLLSAALIAYLVGNGEKETAVANTLRAASILIPIGTLVLIIGLIIIKKRFIKG